MTTYVYGYDSTTKKPRITTTDEANLLLRDGTRQLSGTWNAGAYNIQVSVDPSNANDLTRKSWVESQISSATGPFGPTHIFSGEANGADPASVGIGARFLVTSAYSTYSVGDVIVQLTLDPTFEAAVVENSDVYVARVQLANSTSATSDSSVIDAGEITVWNSTSSKWVTVGSIIAIPDATGGSGGNTKGLVTIDTDKGLSITSGILGANIDTNKLEFLTSVNTGSVSVKESGLDHAALNNLNSSSYTHLTATNHTDLTDGGDSTLHYHAADRNRANHTGTQLASTISDFASAADQAANMLLVTNNTGGQLDAGTVVTLHTVAGEVVVSDASDNDLADFCGVVVANIADAAQGYVRIAKEATVLTDADLTVGRWVYVGGGAAAGKASSIFTGSYYEVKMGIATDVNKVKLEKQWIG